MNEYYCSECFQPNSCICVVVTFTNCKSCYCKRLKYYCDIEDRCKDKNCEYCRGYSIVCDCDRKNWTTINGIKIE